MVVNSEFLHRCIDIGTLVALNMADLPLLVLPQKLFAGMNSSSLLAIPFFILAGNLMSRSITGKLIDVANALIGRIKGSLALVTIVASGPVSYTHLLGHDLGHGQGVGHKG